MQKYDYLIVGAGLFGSVFVSQAVKAKKKCLVVEKRPHTGGNLYTENVGGITVHVYGPHIFHTSDKKVWDYVNGYAFFVPFINSPLAKVGDKYYHLPFNLHTFNEFWGVETPEEAKAKIESERVDIKDPKNLEEQALSMVGRDFYQAFIKGYTEKQWGRDCKDLPPEVLKRIPLRYEYNDDYYDDVYQGIPKGGYTQMIDKMLEGSTVLLNTDYFDFIKTHPDIAEKTVYTGAIDRFFGYKLGKLEYRSVKFDIEDLPYRDYQKVAVVNYPDKSVPFTRIIEHKRFENGKQDHTVISKEYSVEWKEGEEPYYPVLNEKNLELYRKYFNLSKEEKNVIFGGRLGTYAYLDMHVTVKKALELAEKEFYKL